MSGTRRTPIARSRTPPVTPEAVRLFRAMQRCRCTCEPDRVGHKQCAGCERWWDLHTELRRETRSKLWDWPCIEDPSEGNPHPPGTYNHERWKPDLEARELWRALDQGAREMRRQERAARCAKAAQPEATPDQPPTG
jgi:hypothetical protein